MQSSTNSQLESLLTRMKFAEDNIAALQSALTALETKVAGYHDGDTTSGNATDLQLISDMRARIEWMERKLKQQDSQMEEYKASIEQIGNDVTIVLNQPKQGRDTKQEIVHVVVKGDTLWDIAKRYIQNPFRYKELAKLSKIKNPHKIYPGMRVKIVTYK
ncbi:MAG: LysM peptidoglycan-binding domain-containing protein [Gammaproteobacteria bacterium]|nr:LysM peptidoglycan-binding domain-containing protein [Gammaproteobacteria bacterium]